MESRVVSGMETGMERVTVLQKVGGILLGDHVAVADSWWRRFRGLLAHPRLESGQGLLLLECGSVHTLGMRYPIDVAFLDSDGRVVKCISCLRPWRVGIGGEAAAHTLELPAGRLEATGTNPGDRLIWS